LLLENSQAMPSNTDRPNRPNRICMVWGSPEFAEA
jgi:hypothetical protein